MLRPPIPVCEARMNLRSGVPRRVRAVESSSVSNAARIVGTFHRAAGSHQIRVECNLRV